MAGATGDYCIHDNSAVTCVAIIDDPTIVDRVKTLHDTSVKALNCTINEAKYANCAAHDTILKFFGIAEREQTEEARNLSNTKGPRAPKEFADKTPTRPRLAFPTARIERPASKKQHSAVYKNITPIPYFASMDRS